MNKPGYALLGVFLAALLHTSYNFFLVNSNYPGLALGAIASLGIGLRFSLRAITMHNTLKEMGNTVQHANK
jgi:hypothetical protein